MKLMRRAPAALLLLVLSLPLITPLFASGVDESQLPACCRRNGKHHCAMAASEATLGGIPAGTVVIAEKCPYSPFGCPQLMLPHVFLRSSMGLSARPASISRIAGEAEAGWRISTDRARHKRGPPATLLA